MLALACYLHFRTHSTDILVNIFFTTYAKNAFNMEFRSLMLNPRRAADHLDNRLVFCTNTSPLLTPKQAFIFFLFQFSIDKTGIKLVLCMNKYIKYK